VDESLLRLFGHGDKRISPVASPDGPAQLRQRFAQRNADLDLREIDQEPELVYYSASISVVKDRLNVLGYTSECARQAFQEGLVGERVCAQELLRQREGAEASDTGSAIADSYRKELQVLARLTPDLWLYELQEILSADTSELDGDWFAGPLRGTLRGYMLSNDWFGFPGPDSTAALKLVLEGCPDADCLLYDVTDLVWTEWADRDDDFEAWGAGVSVEEMQSAAKVIVLTEGASDAAILDADLKLLYPHLADYYSFVDFNAMRVGGGAGNLANLVRAFAGAGVVNKTVALFDNDAAGRAAMQTLASLALPQHLVALSLPSLRLLRSYPTIGPSGRADVDVNGLAASIELYLGEDVLADGDGLCPIQWTGYERSLKCYQGEVLDKAGVRKRFDEKLKRTSEDSASTPGPEWDGLRTVLQTVFAAFHELDGARIVESVRDYYVE